MKHRISLAVLSLLFVCGGGLAPRAARAATDPALTAFAAWAKKYVAATPAARTGMEKEGLELATARRPVFQQLIREDPRTALQMALPPETLDLLPESIRSQAEYWVSGRANTSLFRAEESGPYAVNVRELMIRGQIFLAHVYGRRLDQATFWDHPVYGVAMDNRLALAERPVRVVVEGTASNPKWVVDVGGQICTFASAAKLDQYEQAIIASETAIAKQEAQQLASRPKTVRIETVVTFNEKDVRISRDGVYDVIRLASEDMPSGTPGAPWLPSRTVNIQIPAGAWVTNLTVKAGEKLWKTNVWIKPAQPVVFGDPEKLPEFCGPDPVVYQSTARYPAGIAETQTVLRACGISFLPVRLHPVRYVPASQRVYFAGTIRLVLDCVLPKVNPAVASDDLSDIRETLDLWPMTNAVPEADPQVRLPPIPKMAQGPQVRCDYLIIAPERFRAVLEPLAQHRRANGFQVEILSTEWIGEHYSLWPNGTPAHLFNRIRHCIRDYKQNRGTHFVLLGGNADVVSAFIRSPLRDREPGPSDLYYMGLDYEPFCQDGVCFDVVDYTPDIYLGRLPFHDASQFEKYVRNVIDYETHPPRDLARKVLLVGNELWTNYVGNDRPSDAMSDYHLAFRDAHHPRVSDGEMWVRRAFRDKFQANGWAWTADQPKVFCDTLTSYDQPNQDAGNYLLSHDHLRQCLAEGWNFVVHYSHGNTNRWGLEGDERLWGRNLLDGGRPSLFVYSSSCLSADFGTSDCLGSEFLCHLGTMGYIGSSSEGIGVPDEGSANGDSTGGASMVAQRAFYQYAFSAPCRERGFMGAAFNAHKAYLGSRHDDEDYAWMAHIVTLLGDPAVPLMGIKPQIRFQVVTDVSTVEGDRQLPEFYIRRYGFSSIPLTIRYAVGGTARHGTDFSTLPPASIGGELTFAAGETQKLFQVCANRDLAMEPEETIVYRILEGEDYEVYGDPLTIRVADTTPPYTLTVAAVRPFAYETVVAAPDGNRNGCFRVTRSGEADRQDDLHFTYAMSGSAGSLDYDSQAFPDTGVIPAGQDFVDLTVSPIDDDVEEAVETITLQLTASPDGRYMLSGNPADPTRATVTLFSEDKDPVIQWIRPQPPRVQAESGSALTVRLLAYDMNTRIDRMRVYIDNQRVHEDAVPVPAGSMNYYEAAITVPYGEHVLRAEVQNPSGYKIESEPITLVGDSIPAGAGRGLLRELWEDIPGGRLTDLYQDPRFPQRPDERDEAWQPFCSDGYPDMAEEYAERFRGYFLAPITGDYRFLLQGNDYAELRISPDEIPAHGRRVAYDAVTNDMDDEAAWGTQTTAVVRLVGGSRYYIEARHKESTGYDWLKVGVILPGGQREMPIPGHRLEPWIVRPGITLAYSEAMDEVPGLSVAEGGGDQIYRVLLNTEPEAEQVRVGMVVDGQQLQSSLDVMVFVRSNWWRPYRMAIQAVDDHQCEISPVTSVVEYVCTSEDSDYENVPSVYLNVEVTDNETNQAPRLARVWPKASQVYSTSSRVQVLFEVRATDDGQPGPLTTTWSARNGANLQTGTVRRLTVTNAVGVFPRAGNFSLACTASDGWVQTALVYSVKTAASTSAYKRANFAPVISAGPDLAVRPNAVANLRGSARDDGRPVRPGRMTVKWEVVSGPGRVEIGNPARAATTFRAKALGRYVLRLTVHDGEVKVYDDVAITVSKTAPVRP